MFNLEFCSFFIHLLWFVKWIERLFSIFDDMTQHWKLPFWYVHVWCTILIRIRWFLPAPQLHIRTLACSIIFPFITSPYMHVSHTMQITSQTRKWKFHSCWLGFLRCAICKSHILSSSIQIKFCLLAIYIIEFFISNGSRFTDRHTHTYTHDRNPHANARHLRLHGWVLLDCCLFLQ